MAGIVAHTQVNESAKHSAGGAQLTDVRATAADNPEPFVITDEKPEIKDVPFASQWAPISSFSADRDAKEPVNSNSLNIMEETKNVDEIINSAKMNIERMEEVKVEVQTLNVQQNVCTVCRLLQVLSMPSSSPSERATATPATDA
eukprot:TRINITY_DN1611_c0_g2_i2.p2 TRINITY_DN1611_c0_g2~~TRINITY_DN1611_c0_g2_i2.p2  ORF type:complete len:145 (-),score=44.13 TRINITY_DN1611_c0_g2_i2:538-972(-)